MASAGGYELSLEAIARARDFRSKKHGVGEHIRQRALARNVFERAVAAQANRVVTLLAPDRQALCGLLPEDMPAADDV